MGQKKEKMNIDRIKGVLFDMDGVLFDSMPLHARAWVMAFQHVGMPFSEMDVYRNEGSRGSDTVQYAFRRETGHECSKEEETRIYQYKSRQYESFPEPEPMKGAIDVVRTLKEHGVNMTVVTGSGEKTTIDRLIRLFDGCFEREKLVTAMDVKIGKPHPEPYLKGLEKLGTKREETIVIENAPMGIESGVAAGMFTIGVNTGPLDAKELAAAGANLVLGSMKELNEWLLKEDD